MDIGIPSPQTILILSFNIFRLLCRRYGMYFIFGLVILTFQGFSGYYISHNTRSVKGNIDVNEGLQRENQYQKSIENSKLKLNNLRTYESSQNVLPKEFPDEDISTKVKDQIILNADTHNKGPPKGFNISHYGDVGFVLPCEITSKEVVSALQRAKTLECRKVIANISCEVQKGTFYPSRLISFCPTYGHIRGRPMGCFKDRVDDRILRGHTTFLKKNSPSTCADICFQRGYIYSGVQYAKECFCGNNDLPAKFRVSDSECATKCAGNSDLKCGGYLRISIVETGLAKTKASPLRKASNDTQASVKIAYILTVNGRSLRQVLRLFKVLFHLDHFFFIHVDARQHFLYRELLPLEKRFPNVVLSRKRYSSIWGGSSLLHVLLHSMKELLLKADWKWDFVINLSESDFPIKTNTALVEFLTANRDRNFLKSHGHDTNKFLQKQGLDRTFLECETHMWRIGERKLPLGIRIDGGSDWVCLNRQFVEYITLSSDVLIDGLKKVFSYTLLPGESFFHTVLRNSEYCHTFADNNLHVTNWKRKLGCRCQYKHIVDWCGCSPNDFTPNDWTKLEVSKRRNLFFARKFEAVKSLAAINKVDEMLYGRYEKNTFNLNSSWDNTFHFEDPPSGKEDAGLTLFHSAMRLSASMLRNETSSVSLKATKDSHGCQIITVLPTQAHSHHADDQFQGIVVEFLARTKSGVSLKLETLIRPKLALQRRLAEHPFSRRIINLEVNSHFDLKEQMFRNFGGHLGPESEIWVALWLKPLEAEEEDEGKAEKSEAESKVELEVLLVDPVHTLAARSTLTVEEGEEVITHAFTLATPLRPGIWEAYLLLGSQLLVSLRFPVLPMQFVQGRQISVAEGRKLHSGPRSPYSSVGTSDLKSVQSVEGLPVMPSAFPGNSTLAKAADHLSLTFGPELSKWIDQIVDQSFFIHGVCYSSSDVLPRCLKERLSPCSETHWSSYSADPKSELGGVDPETGRFSDPFRRTEGS